MISILQLSRGDGESSEAGLMLRMPKWQIRETKAEELRARAAGDERGS